MTKRRSKLVTTQRTTTRIERASSQKNSSEVRYRAARLMAEEGTVNIAVAIQKAARQLGVTQRGGLPTELEVQSALKLHQTLFQANSQPQECLSLRHEAAEIMRWLDRFSPWLVGAVLDGSANRFSRIELEIILDNDKQLEMFLLNSGTHFETRKRRSTLSHQEKLTSDGSLYEISIREVVVCISLFPHRAARSSQSTNRLKHSQDRLAEVEALLAAG